ncbi:MAG: ABC transporter ATP-binding protein [Nostocoides sp.]
MTPPDPGPGEKSSSAYGVRGLTVSYAGQVALQSATVSVRSGSVVAVVGGDGAGKTTLLRTVVGQLQSDQGHVEAPGRAEVGYQPAGSGSWASLTVAQNLDFVGGIYGLGGRTLAERRAELLAAAGLTDASDRLASQLSGGMRRKLGFCMAIIHRPKLLVLDEPSTGVDPVSRIDLWRLISQAAASGTAVLMSSTYLDEAERAGSLLVLDRGLTVLQGPYASIRETFPGTVTAHVSGAGVARRDWSWRRGRDLHEYWPAGAATPLDAEVIEPDLEDIVVASLLVREHAKVVA